MPFNIETDISSISINLIHEILNDFIFIYRAFILFAQMQSGKTNAFLLFAGEMLRQQKVKHVVIFTGNRENELKKQLITQVRGFGEKISFFNTKYIKYLLEKHNLFENLTELEKIIALNNLVENIKSKIIIIWGTELKKKANKIPRENTLFIFEESHFAQSCEQMPDQFLREIGLPPNGDKSILEEKGNYICSVSATPFSELYDNSNFKQSKKIIYLYTDEYYRGVKWFKENNKILGFNNWKETFRNALKLRREDVNWAIIRVRGDDNVSTAERISIEEGWKVKKYDQELTEIEDMTELEEKPDFPTIIIIREKCRMGTVISKKYLSFLFETSINMKTDTLLQGLLGRACGYHTNNNLVVYINMNILTNGEIDRYIALWNGINIGPKRAKNVKISNDDSMKFNKRDFTFTRYTIPIEIPHQFISELDYLSTRNLKKDEKCGILEDMINAIKDKLAINYNDNFTTEKLINQLIDNRDKIISNHEDNDKIHWHYFTNTRNDTFENVPVKIIEAIENKKSVHLSSGCSGGTTIYYVGKHIEGLNNCSFYLCSRISLTCDELSQENINEIPDTTGEEIFRYDNSDNIDGGFSLIINEDAVRDKNIMYETIKECIYRSRETETMLISPKCITSIPQPYFEKHNCIYLSENVYNSLNCEGEIYNKIYEEFNIRLNICKIKGRPPTNMPSNCSKRIKKISW